MATIRLICSRNVTPTLARTPVLHHYYRCSRLLSTSHVSSQQTPTTTVAEKQGTKSFAIASRLKEGRALALDVWSVFK